MTIIATDPNGIVHTYTGTRPVAYAVFHKNKTTGNYYGHFAKTLDAARRHWGSDGTGFTRAVEA